MFMFVFCLFSKQNNISFTEAYLASMSAANHHQALYGINATALPPFLEQTPVSAHGATPLSLVKQEPREMSCTEKAAKQGERRAVGFKVDLDLNRGSRETFFSSSASSAGGTQLKEAKLSPSMSMGAAGKPDKKGSNSNISPGGGSGGGHQNGKKSAAHCSTSLGSATRHHSDGVRSKCTSPSSRPVPPALISSKTVNSSGSKNPASKTSVNVSKHTKTSTSGHVASSSNSSKTLSPSSVMLSESPVISVPTQAAAPIPLATVQHDGVVLSALASPSSAAASSASSKPTVLKQQPDKLSRSSNGDKELADVGKSVSEANTSTGLPDRLIDATLCYDRMNSGNQSNGSDGRDASIIGNSTNTDASGDKMEDSKQLSDDSSDIVVDSTESDDIPAADSSPLVPKSDHDRAVEETIEKVASAADSFTESQLDCPVSPQCAKNSADRSSASTLSVARKEISCIVTSSGSPSGTRTVYAKTQSVSAVTVSGMNLLYFNIGWFCFFFVMFISLHSLFLPPPLSLFLK